MRKLVVFNNVTLDGYFTDCNGDMSWAYAGNEDREFRSFVAGNAKGGGQLLFGRKTYELMASYWPTQLAAKNDPVVAGHMNALSKIVFSRTMQRAEWDNTRLVRRGLVAYARKLKQESGPGLVILGSGSIVAQLAQAGLIDEFQFVLNPVILGAGRTLFDGVKRRLALKRTKLRAFRNGKVFVCYEPER